MEDRAFELLEKMYSEFTEFRKETSAKFSELDKGTSEKFNKLESEVKKTNLTIEHDIKPKINALFDGYIQITSQLDRIENVVSRHEDVIIKKVK